MHGITMFNRGLVLLVALLIIVPTSGCLRDTTDDMELGLSTPLLVPTEWNGSVHWEARFVVLRISARLEHIAWSKIDVELQRRDGPESEALTVFQPDTGQFTDQPAVFFNETNGVEGRASSGDIIRLTGLAPRNFPMVMRVLRTGEIISRVEIEDLPRAHMAFGEDSSALVVGDTIYRTYYLPIVDIYPDETQIPWKDIKIDVLNKAGVQVYYNTSLRLRNDQGLISVPPPELENAVTVMYFSNETDPVHITPGDALYFPGMHKDMKGSLVEVTWQEGLIGRAILVN